MTPTRGTVILVTVMVAAKSRVQVCCDSCYRTSPSKDGSVDDARAQFRALGWTWHPDGRLLCPICNSRESTLRPPPAADKDE
jgi:hypothetical protein